MQDNLGRTITSCMFLLSPPILVPPFHLEVIPISRLWDYHVALARLTITVRTNYASGGDEDKCHKVSEDPATKLGQRRQHQARIFYEGHSSMWIREKSHACLHVMLVHVTCKCCDARAIAMGGRKKCRAMMACRKLSTTLRLGTWPKGRTERLFFSLMHFAAV